MQYCSKYFIILCLTGTGLASPALAQQEAVPPAVQALLDNIERGTTLKPAHDSLTNDGGTVTITNLALNKAAGGVEPPLPVKIAQTELSGLRE